MKSYIVIGLLALLGLGGTAWFVDTHGTTASPHVYTVAQVATNLRHAPKNWAGRTVLVRGEVRLVGAAAFRLGDVPLFLLVDPPVQHMHIGPIDLGSLVDHMRGVADDRQPAQLLLTQQPSSRSRQQLDPQHIKAYLVRLTLTHWYGGTLVPTGEIV